MAIGQEHTVKAFDQDIKQLRALISQMGGLAEQAIHDAMKALQRGDTALADQVRGKDKQIARKHAYTSRALRDFDQWLGVVPAIAAE